MKYILVFITTKSSQEAFTISRALLSERLAACVNIVKNIQSRYWLEGKLQRRSETLLLVKTQKSLIKKVIKRATALHSDTCPGIIALPIMDGNPQFLNWISQETSPTHSSDMLSSEF